MNTFNNSTSYSLKIVYFLNRTFQIRRKTWQKTYGVISNPLNRYPSSLSHNSSLYKITPQPCLRSEREQTCYHVPSCHTTLAQTTSRGVTLSQLIISRTADRSRGGVRLHAGSALNERLLSPWGTAGVNTTAAPRRLLMDGYHLAPCHHCYMMPSGTRNPNLHTVYSEINSRS